MAAFAKASFNARLYSASRPTYPQQMFDYIFRYHERIEEDYRPMFRPDEYRRAVDLGCGTGQATLGLLPFKEIIAVDPSKTMTETAQKYISKELKRERKGKMMDKFIFKNASAEELPFLDNASVDLVIAAQAAHWFDWNKVWPELNRILRSQGTVGILGYSEMRFTCYSSLTPLIEAFTRGTNPETSLGPHWQQPGRSIVENLLCDIPEARRVVDNFEERRIYFSDPHTPPHLKDEDCRAVELRKKMSWEDFEAYLRSFSAFHTFQERNKDDAKHPDGDIVQRFIKTVKAEMRKTEPSYSTDIPVIQIPKIMAAMDVQNGVLVEWPSALILAKKVRG